MRLLLTFQMQPFLRRRMLAPLTKRTKQSTLFECDEERSATPVISISFPIISEGLNAMKSGVQLLLEQVMSLSKNWFECDEERSATLFHYPTATLRFSV